jgi:hypothetical protein
MRLSFSVRGTAYKPLLDEFLEMSGRYEFHGTGKDFYKRNGE